MPVTKSAKKALHQDKKRTVINLRIKGRYKAAVKNFREDSTAQNFKKAFSEIDKTAKKGVIHKNKAARLKSRLAKLLPQKLTKKTTSRKKTAKKKS